jgi:hypothetical protein
MLQIKYLVAWGILIFAIYLDVLTLFLRLRANCKGYGDSGVPAIVTLGMYYLFVLITRNSNVYVNLIYLGCLIVVNIMSHLVIPMIHKKWLLPNR